MEKNHIHHVRYLLPRSPLPALASHRPHVFQTLGRNLIFGAVTSIMVGNVLLPKGPIGGVLAVTFRSGSGLSLFYLLGLIFLFFHVRALIFQTRE